MVSIRAGNKIRKRSPAQNGAGDVTFGRMFFFFFGFFIVFVLSPLLDDDSFFFHVTTLFECVLWLL